MDATGTNAVAMLPALPVVPHTADVVPCFATDNLQHHVVRRLDCGRLGDLRFLEHQRQLVLADPVDLASRTVASSNLLRVLVYERKPVGGSLSWTTAMHGAHRDTTWRARSLRMPGMTTSLTRIARAFYDCRCTGHHHDQDRCEERCDGGHQASWNM